VGFLAQLAVLISTLVLQAPPPPPPPPNAPLPRELAPCEAYWRACVVFSGEVVSIATPKPPYVLGPNRVTFQVDRRPRGEIDDTIEVIVGMGRDVQLARGGKYVIYASTFGIQGLTAHRTRRFDDAREDLEYIGRADRETSGGLVLGTVRTGDEATQPAAGFRVVMGNSDGEWTATTDADGIFRFTRIPAGRYGIMIDVPDGYGATGPGVIDIPDPRACAQPQFRRAGRRYIIGTVARPDGTPLRLADIVLRSAARLSRGKQVGARVKTDAQGRFSIAGVSGYRYYVEVSLSVEGQNPRLYAVSEEFALTAKTPPLHIVRGAR